jgi:hypothetical protein
MLKVFISSFRSGLEEERDSLPGPIAAIGHEPLRFEDFTAQSVLSREACLRGVAAADVYLLLLGPNYGTVFPETGRSPTHEEYVAAQARGIHRLVFRKAGVGLDDQQARFVEEVEAYSTGVFRDSFHSAVDLQAKVVAALRNLPAGALEWRPLTDPVELQWRTDWSGSRSQPRGAELEVHVCPCPPVRRSRRELSELPDQLASRLRAMSLVSATDALDVGADESAAWAFAVSAGRRPFGEVEPGAFSGCRIGASGQRSVWEQLPSDSMGVILDATDLTNRVARSLRTVGGLVAPDASQYAVAVGLHTSAMTIVGNVAQLGNRCSASGFSVNERDIRLDPDESISPAGLDRGAEEVAAPLVRALLEQFQARGR